MMSWSEAILPWNVVIEGGFKDYIVIYTDKEKANLKRHVTSLEGDN